MMYHLFAFDDYYPVGGLGDYMGSFPTYQEAKDAIGKFRYSFGNTQILQEVDGKLIKVFK